MANRQDPSTRPGRALQWCVALVSVLILAIVGAAQTAGRAEAAAPTVARITIATPFTGSFGPHSGDIGPFPGEWDETNADITVVAARADRIEVAFSGGTADRSSRLEIEPEDGQRFRLGFVRLHGFQDADLYYLGTGCGFESYDIHDLGYDGDAIVRLDLTWTTFCTGGPLAGSLHLGPATAPALGATTFTWPQTAIGQRSPIVAPLWVRNPANTPLTLGRLTTSGASAAEFTVLDDQCSGRRLPARQGCAVRVRFDPQTAGAKSASLVLPSDSGAIRIGLGGGSPDGRTLLRMNSDPGESIGAGFDYLYTEAESPFPARGWPTDVDLSVEAVSTEWSVWLASPDPARTVLAPGRYAIGDTPGTVVFSVSGRGAGCAVYRGTVDIRQLVYGAYGELLRYNLVFDQYCQEDPAHHLRGEVAYRATTPAIPPSGNSVLRTGQSLSSGHALPADGRAPNHVVLTRAGQLSVIDDQGRITWSTPAQATTPRAARISSRLQVTSDGSLTITDSRGRFIWAQRPAGHRAGDFLALRNDGVLVLYSPDYVPLWSSAPLEFRFG